MHGKGGGALVLSFSSLDLYALWILVEEFLKACAEDLKKRR